MKRVRVTLPGRVRCDRPLEVYDDVTGLSYGVVRCKQRDPEKCAQCGERHRRNVARIGRSGFVDDVRNRAFMVTLSAPGADVLPWDVVQCMHGPEVECSGKIGCRVEAWPAHEWHKELPLAWSHFVEYVRRALPGVEVEFMKTYEWQDRGVLHAHVLMRFAGVVTERRVRAAIRSASRRWGFGPQRKVDAVDMSNARSVARAAGYCAKYVTKMLGEKRGVVDTSTGEVLRVRVRPWSASRRWGDSMKSIVDRQRLWAVAQATACSAPAGCAGGGAAAGDAAGIALDLNGDFYTQAGSTGPGVAAVVGA